MPPISILSYYRGGSERGPQRAGTSYTDRLGASDVSLGDNGGGCQRLNDWLKIASFAFKLALSIISIASFNTASLIRLGNRQGVGSRKYCYHCA
jgi:hypothetical protein